MEPVPAAPPAQPTHTPSEAAVLEFLGLVGYSGLGSFGMLAADAQRAPDLRSRLVLAHMAAGELAELDYVEEVARVRGADFEAMLADYRDLLEDFGLRAVPRDWWERLVRTYVGYNMLQDLLRELGEGLPAELRDAIAANLGRSGHDEFVAAELLPVLERETQLASRLALWGRRVVGDGLSLVQRLFRDHPPLAELATGEGDAEARVAALTGRLQQEHARRLGRLGLNA